jgi:hypothetical protein
MYILSKIALVGASAALAVAVTACGGPSQAETDACWNDPSCDPALLAEEGAGYAEELSDAEITQSGSAHSIPYFTYCGSI